MNFIKKNINQNNFQNNNELINKINILEKDKSNLLNKIKELENENNRLKIFESEINTLKNKLKKYEEENKNLKNNLNKYENEIKKLKNENKDLDKILNEEKTKNLKKNENNNKDKIIELMEQINIKDKEIREIKSNNPYELKKGEKLMTVIFFSFDQTIHYSLICKNTDKFIQIENLLFQEFPEYQDSEYYFMANGVKINRYKTLEELKIKNSEIISMNQFD